MATRPTRTLGQRREGKVGSSNQAQQGLWAGGAASDVRAPIPAARALHYECSARQHRGGRRLHAVVGSAAPPRPVHHCLFTPPLPAAATSAPPRLRFACWEPATHLEHVWEKHVYMKRKSI